MLIEKTMFDKILGYAKETAEQKCDILISKLIDEIRNELMKNSNESDNSEKNFIHFCDSLDFSKMFDNVKEVLPLPEADEDTLLKDDSVDSIEESASPLVSSLKILMINRNNPDDYIYNVPIVFLGTEDRSYGAGIAKYYADKYPNLRKSDIGTKKGFSTLYTNIDLFDSDECRIEDIGKPEIPVFFALTPKSTRFDELKSHHFQNSLESLFLYLKENNIEKIAMPKIGSVREHMEWDDTINTIKCIGKLFNYNVIFENDEQDAEEK